MAFETTGLEQDLLRLEGRFWTEGIDFYREHLHSECVMLFPSVGALTRDGILAGVAGGVRWAEVRITDVRLVSLAGGAVILAYSAQARRSESGESYTALVSSAYVEQPGGWKLAFHQQSPSSPS
jgi:hypothetical protein